MGAVEILKEEKQHIINEWLDIVVMEIPEASNHKNVQ